MRWPQLPIIPLLTCLILGYIGAAFFGFSPRNFFIPVALAILCFSVGVLWSSTKKYRILFQSLGLYLFWGACAYGLYAYHHQLPNAHYSKVKTLGTYSVVIEDALGKRGKATRYYGRMLQNNRQVITGKILLIVVSPNDSAPITPGSVLVTSKKLVSIPKASAIEDFDYATYLERLGIYHQLVLFQGEFITAEERYSSLKLNVIHARNYCLNRLQKSSLSEASKQTLAALVWGERQALDQAQLEAYTKAGAVHLLAISGLHIGLVTFFLVLLLRPLRRFLWGRYLQQTILLIVLWAYALLTGMLPSVVRAVTMFSILGFLHFRKQLYYPLNSVLVSAFLLLLVYPPYLFSVGFQMSYCAVLGILVGMERSKNWWQPKQQLLRYFWRLCLVSLWAQVAVAPLSIYYFKQFPGLFFISNLLLLPGFGVLLGLSYLLMLGVLLQFQLSFLAHLHRYIVNFYTEVVKRIAAQEQFLFEGLQLYWWEVLLCYTIIFLVLQYKGWSIYWRRGRWLGIYLLVLGMLALRANENSKVTWWVVKDYRTTVVMASAAKGTQVWARNPKLSFDQLHKKPIKVHRLPHFFIHNKQRLLLCQDSLAFKFKAFQPTHLLLTQSPKIDFKRLLLLYTPEQVIFATDNAPWLVKKWQQSCKELAIPCHDIALEGSFRLIP